MFRGTHLGGAVACSPRPPLPPPPPAPWLGPHATPCKRGSTSLPPSFAQLCSLARPGLCVCRQGRYWPSGDFPADLHVALLVLRAFLFTSLRREGEPDARSLRLQQHAHRPHGAWRAGRGPGGSPCWGPGCLEPAAGLWALGACSRGSRWIVKSRRCGPRTLDASLEHELGQERPLQPLLRGAYQPSHPRRRSWDQNGNDLWACLFGRHHHHES